MDKKGIVLNMICNNLKEEMKKSTIVNTIDNLDCDGNISLDIHLTYNGITQKIEESMKTNVDSRYIEKVILQLKNNIINSSCIYERANRQYGQIMIKTILTMGKLKEELKLTI